MENKKITFMRENIECSGNADVFTVEDIPIIEKAYYAWKASNEVYATYGMRRANLPELISEGLTSAMFGWPRTNGTSFSGLPASSMDLIDMETGDMVQLKACSTDAVHKPGPTSFGPTTEFDSLIFMHVDCETDTINWYKLDAESYKDIKVNRTETIGDQQKQGRRPRVTLLPKILSAGIEPFYTYDIGEHR